LNIQETESQVDILYIHERERPVGIHESEWQTDIPVHTGERKAGRHSCRRGGPQAIIHTGDRTEGRLTYIRETGRQTNMRENGRQAYLQESGRQK
jgi:hypothetical protein